MVQGGNSQCETNGNIWLTNTEKVRYDNTFSSIIRRTINRSGRKGLTDCGSLTDNLELTGNWDSKENQGKTKNQGFLL